MSDCAPGRRRGKFFNWVKISGTDLYWQFGGLRLIRDQGAPIKHKCPHKALMNLKTCIPGRGGYCVRFDGMKHASANKSFEPLSMVGLAIERCHIVEGLMVRVYFRLSGPPPLGWSFTFTTAWKAVQYPQKREAGVEGDAIWIECIPAEVASYHFEELEKAVAQTNGQYREKAAQHALRAGRQAQLSAQTLSQLADLHDALYPAAVPVRDGIATSRFWGSALMAKLKALLRRSKGEED